MPPASSSGGSHFGPRTNSWAEIRSACLATYGQFGQPGLEEVLGYIGFNEPAIEPSMRGCDANRADKLRGEGSNGFPGPEIWSPPRIATCAIIRKGDDEKILIAWPSNNYIWEADAKVGMPTGSRTQISEAGT
jgi:hypothetical protein